MITSTDPIADFLTRIRNASAVRKPLVVAPFSKMKMEIAKILEQEGYVRTITKNENMLEVELKYNVKGEPKIKGLKRISKPGLRIYRGMDALPKVVGGTGIAIISTPQGLKTNKEAHRIKVGGEVVCEIW